MLFQNPAGGLGAGQAEAVFREDAVVLGEPGKLPAGGAGSLRSQLQLQAAQVVLGPEGAVAAGHGDDPVPVSVYGHGLPQRVPQGTGQAVIKAGGGIVHHHLPAYTAVVRTG